MQRPRLVNLPNDLPVIYRLRKVSVTEPHGGIRKGQTSCEMPRILERIVKSSGAVRRLRFVYRPSRREFINPACRNALDVKIV